MNPDLSGAIFTLSLSILILNSQCVEGARNVRVPQLTPVICLSRLDVMKEKMISHSVSRVKKTHIMINPFSPLGARI